VRVFWKLGDTVLNGQGPKFLVFLFDLFPIDSIGSATCFFQKFAISLNLFGFWVMRIIDFRFFGSLFAIMINYLSFLKYWKSNNQVRFGQPPFKFLADFKNQQKRFPVPNLCYFPNR